MVKHRRTKKYGITDGVSPLSSEFFLSDSSVLSLRSSSCGQNCGGNRHVYANTSVSNHVTMNVKSNLLLMTCQVLVESPDGSVLKSRALLDSGSIYILCF